jgi:tight adherence protein B
VIPLLVLVLFAAMGAVGYRAVRGSNSRVPLAVAARLDRYGIGGTVDIGRVDAPSEGNGAAVAITSLVERLFGRGKYAQKVQLKLERADLKMTRAEFMTINFGTVLVGGALGLLLHGFLGMLALGTIGTVAPNLYLGRKVKRRQKKFIEQLSDLAQMMGNSMRAGFSILQSMELVGREAAEPASTEFERVVTEVKLGLTVDTALDHMLERMPSEDLGLMIIAINVQRVVGGNLAEILMVISNTIRQRVRFQRDLQALTAQARYSSYIITALPVAVAVAINFLDPSYEKMLYTTTLGYLMIAMSVTMLSIGFFILNKIATIEV